MDYEEETNDEADLGKFKDEEEVDLLEVEEEIEDDLFDNNFRTKDEEL
jgi:hypothetical protein